MAGAYPYGTWLGGTGAAIYLFYSLFAISSLSVPGFCSGQASVTLPQVLPFTGGSTDPMVLRTFIGTPELGWKVAWSDRMVSFYGGWFLFAALYALGSPARPRIVLEGRSPSASAHVRRRDDARHQRSLGHRAGLS